MPKPQRVLFVGYRRGTIKVAARCGFSSALWTPVPVAENALRRQGLEMHLHAPFINSTHQLSENILKFAQNYSPDAVIALTEASVVPAAILRETLGLPGLNFSQASCCRDKYLMKKTARTHNLAVTPFRLIRESTPSDILARQLGFPLVIKQRSSSGSRGLKVLVDRGQLDLYRENDFLAEAYINGREVSTELFVQEGKIVFQNITEYYQHLAINIVPGRISPQEQLSVQSVANQVVTAFGIERGIVHLELFLTSNGPVFGELAVRPPGGYLMDLIHLAYEFNPWEALIQMELGNSFTFPTQAQKFTAAYVLHPGPGQIRSIAGIEQIKGHPLIKSFKLKRQVGENVTERQGSGNDIGRILFSAPTHKELIDVVEWSRSQLKIEM